MQNRIIKQTLASNQKEETTNPNSARGKAKKLDMTESNFHFIF